VDKTAQKRKKCKACNYLLILWGKTASGVIRYHCTHCRKNYSSYQKPVADWVVLLQWFREYILHGITYQVLSRWSKIPTATLRYHFNQLLLENPPFIHIPLITAHQQYLLTDGLWFGRLFVLMVYKLTAHAGILHASIARKEWSYHISRDLKLIRKRGVILTGIVSDGATGITRAVTEVFGAIPHQICLAHMHRSLISCLGIHPKEPETQALRAFADEVWDLKTRAQLKAWNKQLKGWVKNNQNYLLAYHTDETGRWWYAHTRVRKAVRILKTIPKRSFVFLGRNSMPRTTNELEGIFSNLTVKWLMHRGLSQRKWPSFLLWFLYFRSLKSKPRTITKKLNLPTRS